MKRTRKYVALDVHQATTVASVREESGGVLGRQRPPRGGPGRCSTSMRGWWPAG